MKSQFSYRPDIDGLRALAVMPVLLFHAGFSTFSGGYVGVDIFFVISGFLITSIILGELASGTFSIVAFYKRRIRRIMPALLAVVTCSIPLAWAWATPDQLSAFAKSVIGVATFTSNVLFWLDTDYFAPSSELVPLLHTWSLAVEEQFYVFYPVAMILLWRFGLRVVSAALLLVFCASLLLANWGSTHSVAANFFLLPTRLWELLAGSLCALALHRMNPQSINRWRQLPYEIAGTIGIVMIFIAIVTMNSSSHVPGFAALLPTVGTVLVIVSGTRTTLVRRVLSQPPLVAAGLISYSLYLWHQPVLSFARMRAPVELTVHTKLLLLAGCVVLAALTWQFVEKPFRMPRSSSARGNAATIPLLFPVIPAVLFVFAMLVIRHDGVPTRTTPTGMQFASVDNSHQGNPNAGLDITCEGTVDEPVCRTSDSPEIIVWGDSYAKHLVYGLVASRPDIRLAQMTKNVCGPALGVAPVFGLYTPIWARECMAFNASVVDWVSEHPSVRYVVMSSALHPYLLPDSRWLTEQGYIQKNTPVLGSYFADTVARLKALGVTPVLFAPLPETGSDYGRCFSVSQVQGYPMSTCDFTLEQALDYQRDQQPILERIEQEVRVIRLSEYLCKTGVCKPYAGQLPLYRDEGHLSITGSQHLGRMLDFYSLVTDGNQ